jgi:hypothetical protein
MKKVCGGAVLIIMLTLAAGAAQAQRAAAAQEDAEFGPVVRGYLGYLRNEQEVVDDRNSRHEISPRYYRRNSNRVRALRQMAIRIARETENDYLPELEAVAADELRSLFENPPSPGSLRVGKIFNNTFRFLGTVRSGENFYLFARLDPYEQADLMEQEKRKAVAAPQTVAPVESQDAGQAQTRQRRSSNAP